MKKQSEPKSSSPPPSPSTIFVDRSLGSKKIPDGLRAAGIDIEIHDEHFARDEDDATWLRYCGAKKWIVLTKDERIRRDPAEVREVIDSGVHAVFIGRQDTTAEQMLQDVVPALPRLLKRFTDANGPLYVLVHKGGRLEYLVVKTLPDGTQRLARPDPSV